MKNYRFKNQRAATGGFVLSAIMLACAPSAQAAPLDYEVGNASVRVCKLVYSDGRPDEPLPACTTGNKDFGNVTTPFKVKVVMTNEVNQDIESDWVDIGPGPKCEPLAVSWLVNGQTCNGTTTQTAVGSTIRLTDTTGPATGSGSFTCTTGTAFGGWSRTVNPSPADTCVAAPVACESINPADIKVGFDVKRLAGCTVIASGTITKSMFLHNTCVNLTSFIGSPLYFPGASPAAYAKEKYSTCGTYSNSGNNNILSISTGKVSIENNTDKGLVGEGSFLKVQPDGTALSKNNTKYPNLDDFIRDYIVRPITLFASSDTGIYPSPTTIVFGERPPPAASIVALVPWAWHGQSFSEWNGQPTIRIVRTTP